MSNKRVYIVQDTILQENKKIEELIGVCVELVAKISSVEGWLKYITRKQEEYSLEFPSSPLQEYIGKAYNTANPPLYIRARGENLSK